MAADMLKFLLKNGFNQMTTNQKRFHYKEFAIASDPNAQLLPPSNKTVLKYSF